MILVADVGGSKGDWGLIRSDEVIEVKSPGFNPKTHSMNVFREWVFREWEDHRNEIDSCYFYGAGIVGAGTEKDIYSLLLGLCPQAKIHVHSDLLGAARSLFGAETGIACILGTGAAAGSYNGREMERRIPGLGFILGDEGSGFYLGKMLVSAFLRGFLPDHLRKRIVEETGEIDEEMVLEQVYRRREAEGIANYVRFIVNNQSDPFINRMVYEGFSGFFEKFFGDLAQMKDKKFRFTGSVAYFLNTILVKVARDHGLIIDHISQSPIKGLIHYHQKYD